MEFTSKATQITFTNQDGERLNIRENYDDFDILELHIRDESFWMSRKNAKEVARILTNMADSMED
jgi:hypothetical protein